ncbi:MAG: DegT/DnrJ/EryC1/StrS family aminotransferase [Acidobacteria bacterium]|nr:DegT/DnrJ/EryC1/StrS family aminotransferase [Acidobacteriota bacterium]
MVPSIDLQAQYRSLKPEIDAAVARVIEGGVYVLGPFVEQFEADLARYCGVRHAVATNSGTSALHLSLLAAGVGAGDEVITVPFTFVATVSAVLYVGARPVFVDIEPDYHCLDVTKVEAALTPRTRAIVPVHLYGQTIDMEPLLEIARRHRLVVIEDACQAHGAEDRGRRAGSMGDIGCFSFYPAKNLGAFGEGGAAVTDNPQCAETMRLLRSWGEKTRYEHTLKGFNYRMDAIQGAVLGVKLRHLNAWTDARRRHAATYRRLLADTPARAPMERPGSRHVYTVYAVRLAQRDVWRARLREAQIETGVHYPIPVHLQPAYRDLGYAEGDFPVSEAAAREVLSLPLFPEMTDGQIEEVARALQIPVAAKADA